MEKAGVGRNGDAERHGMRFVDQARWLFPPNGGASIIVPHARSPIV
jgi:hypothetical protein